MGVLYADGGKIYCNDYMEIYIPLIYFDNKIAINKGSSIETLGILYTRSFPKGVEGDIKLFSVPVIIDVMAYEFKYDEIRVNGMSIDVMVLQYMKDSVIMHQTTQKGREVAEMFLTLVLQGKLPKTLNYTQIIDLWWRNLEMSGVSFKVPSKIYEMIIAAVYRSPNNPKQRYGQYYGRQSNPNGFDYKTGNVREVVKNLSTFSGIVFEDIGAMISNGINNSIEGEEEPVSPLEKIIYY